MTEKETIWCVCRYTPVELFTGGFGCECLRLDPSRTSFDCADSCAHPNLCGFGKGVIEEVTEQNIRYLILTDCCDVMRRVCDVLQQEAQIEFIHLLPLPHRNGERERRLFAGALNELIREWGLCCGLAFDSAGFLKSWVESYRAGKAELEKLRSGPHLTLRGAHAGAHLTGLVKERISLPLDDQSCTGTRIIKVPEEWEAIAESGEDFDEDELLLAYAGALLGQERGCMRMQDRARTKIEDNSRGVLFHTVKFCDYYGFEQRELQKMAEAAGIPLLGVESDGTPLGSGQLATRIDALGEILPREGDCMAQNTGPVNIAAGVDSGSTSTDAVIMDKSGKILGWSIVPTGRGAAAEAAKALDKALEMANLKKEDLDRTVSTGYGREHIGLDGEIVTEITCHAKGSHFLDPLTDTVIDIGGQDSKVIRLDEEGRVISFAMNDKCAAGTGRFLEMMAAALEMPLEEMSRAGLEWKEEVQISSMCTVFAQSEVVSLVADNTPPADIIHGLNKAVASRTASLAARLGKNEGHECHYMMTGGVAKNEGVVKALEEKLGASMSISEHAQICGAIGAALIALGK